MGLLLFCFAYEKTEAQFNDLPTITPVGCGKIRTSDCRTSEFFSFDFVSNAAFVALGTAMQFPDMSMTDQNKLMFHRGQKSALRVEISQPNGLPAPESAQHYLDSALFGTWHLVPSPMWAQCAPWIPWVPCRLWLPSLSSTTASLLPS